MARDTLFAPGGGARLPQLCRTESLDSDGEAMLRRVQSLGPVVGPATLQMYPEPEPLAQPSVEPSASLVESSLPSDDLEPIVHSASDGPGPVYMNGLHSPFSQFSSRVKGSSDGRHTEV